MSIYATNYVIDEETGEAKLIKHLNQKRIDRFSFFTPGKWNKTGKKSRINKGKGIGSMLSHSPKFKGNKRLWKDLSKLQTKFDAKKALEKI
jgi:hypothetical protein